MAKPFVWGPGGAQMTPEQIAAEKKVANALMLRGMDYSPVQHWTQGAARVAQALMGGLDWRMADEASKRNTARDKELLTNLMPLFGGGAAATPAAPAAPAAPNTPAPTPSAAPGSPNARVADAFAAIQPSPAQPNYGGAIAKIESGGRYDALGPVIPKSGDRAYGKYQIMGANIPVWTKQHLGQEMTPQAFLASPEAQDAVFKAQFGQYVNKYGPEGAARAWFAGEGGMNNPNARDVLGTSVADYAQKFTSALGSPPSDMSAQSRTPAAPAPAQAPAAPAGMTPQMAPLIAALSDPAASETTKATARMALQQMMQAQNKTATYGVIGKDQFGNEIYGWVDPRTRTVTPAQGAAPQAAQQGMTPQLGQPAPLNIPAPPPGADPKAWRQTFTKEAAEAAAGAPQAKTRARESIQNLFNTGQKALDLAGHPGLDAAVGPISSKLPTLRENTANFEADVKNLGTRIFINTIGRMRELSKTGGAVGSVTEKEMAKLENAMQSLDLSQGEGNMRKNLTAIAREINASMRNIAEAYKTQYGEELPFEPVKIPDAPASDIDALVKKYTGG